MADFGTRRKPRGLRTRQRALGSGVSGPTRAGRTALPRSWYSRTNPRNGRTTRARGWWRHYVLRRGSNRIPVFVALGTRPADPEHWFAKMLAGSADYAQSHAARPDDPKFRRRPSRRSRPLPSGAYAMGVGGLYVECHRRGELLTLGQRSSDVSALLRVALDRFGRPSRVVADRWREAELWDALEVAGHGGCLPGGVGCVRGGGRDPGKWRGSEDRGIRNLRNKIPSGSYRAQPADRREPVDTGLDRAGIQTGQGAQGCRE